MNKKFLEELFNEEISDFTTHTGKITTRSGKAFFLKTGSPSLSFYCEANGLKEISTANVILTPKVISVGSDYIITEYIEQGFHSTDFFRRLGKQLADLHRVTSSYFGFYEDNFIGVNIQLNIPSEEEKNNWPAFYFNKRLLYQFRLAEKNGFVTSSMRNNFVKLETKMDTILEGSDEPPSLLHGDLWSGNYRCNESQNPVLIDPAVYYGHREADLAMTRVFGGFDPVFYESYMREYPLTEGWEYREPIYKLYHIMNHLNIFGRSYLPEAEYIIRYYVR